MGRKTTTTLMQGKPHGISFDGKRFVPDLDRSFIHRIVIIHGDQVNSVTVYYDRTSYGVCHANTSSPGLSAEILLETGELITTISGRSLQGESWVGHLAFSSNRGRKWGPFGTDTSGQPFTLDPEMLSPPGTRLGLLYFAGSFTNHLGHLEATFAVFPIYGSGIDEIKYEHRDKWEPAPGVPSTLSLFARSLLSPVILLKVGSTPVTFHASQDIICHLPFFRAALQGGFREATDKIINMPDDEPDTVASLLEFLYVGRYTYTFDNEASTEGRAKDMAASSFHVRLHALASKYDCEALVAIQRRSIAHMLDGLEGMEVVSLLREMYDSGFVVRDWDGSKEMAAVKSRIPGILGELYAECEEELDGVWAECPGLATDLLKLLAVGYSGWKAGQ